MLEFKASKLYLEHYEKNSWREKEKNFFSQEIKINGKNYFFLNNNLITNWRESWFPDDYIEEYIEEELLDVGIYIFDFLSIYKLATGKNTIKLGKTKVKFYCPFKVKSYKFATLEEENCFSYSEGYQCDDIDNEWEMEINAEIEKNEDIKFKITLLFNNRKALKFEVILINAEKKEFYDLQREKEENEKFERIKEKRLQIKKQLLSYFYNRNIFDILLCLELEVDDIYFSSHEFNDWDIDDGFSVEKMNDYGDFYRRYYNLSILQNLIKIQKEGKEVELTEYDEDYIYSNDNFLLNMEGEDLIKKKELEYIGSIIYTERKLEE